MKVVAVSIIMIIVAVALAITATYADFSDSEVGEHLLQTGSLDLQLADFDEDFGEDNDSVTQTWCYIFQYPAGMAPGDSLDSAVYLKNVGTLEADHLDIACYIENMEIGNDTDAENEAENNKVAGRDDDHDGLIDEDLLDGLDNDGDGLVDEDLDGSVPFTPGYGIFDKDIVMIINYMKYQNNITYDIVWADGTAWDTDYIDDYDGDGIITLYDFKHYEIFNLAPPVSGLANFSMKVTFGDPADDLNEYQGDQTHMVLVFGLIQ